MAYENRGDTVTVPASTGLKNFRLVALSTAAATQGWSVKPTAGQACLGALCVGGTTGSTAHPQWVSVQVNGIAKLEAAAGTLAAGDFCSASTLGQVKSTTAGAYVIGQVLTGSSGGANRILSVQLLPIGTT